MDNNADNNNNVDFEFDEFVESIIGMTDEEFEAAVNDIYYREDEY